jgi:hypothetical protein
MNLNELFFFKVFQCCKDINNKLKSGSHNESNCYGYHVSYTYENGIKKLIEKDRRREPISFPFFFKKLSYLINEENFTLSLNTIFEFKNDDKNLNYYTDSVRFDDWNQEIYYPSDCCYNETEFFYHIKRYKKNICRFFKSSGKCKNKFCYARHIINENEIEENKNNKDENDIKTIHYENIDKGITYFETIINKWSEKKEIQLKEIIEIYDYILSFNNRFLSTMQINETKQYFIPFQNWYNDINNKINNINRINNSNNIYKHNEPNINNQNIIKYQNEEKNSNERIIRDIYNQLNTNNNENKIYKGSSLFDSLKISTNVCYISKYNAVKLGEVVKYVFTLLNSSDGVIIYGANEDDKSIKGICLKKKERDEFKKWFNTEFLKILVEYEGHIKFQFYDLVNNNNEEECVLVIYIKQIKQNKFLISNSNKYLVIKEDLLNKNKEKNQILNENDIVELDSKQYIEFLRKRFLNYYSKKFGVNMDKTDSL